MAKEKGKKTSSRKLKSHLIALYLSSVRFGVGQCISFLFFVFYLALGAVLEKLCMIGENRIRCAGLKS